MPAVVIIPNGMTLWYKIYPPHTLACFCSAYYNDEHYTSKAVYIQMISSGNKKDRANNKDGCLVFKGSTDKLQYSKTLIYCNMIYQGFDLLIQYTLCFSKFRNQHIKHKNQRNKKIKFCTDLDKPASS